MTQCTFITIRIVSDFSDVSAECQKRSALQRYEPVLLGLTYSKKQGVNGIWRDLNADIAGTQQLLFFDHTYN